MNIRDKTDLVRELFKGSSSGERASVAVARTRIPRRSRFQRHLHWQLHQPRAPCRANGVILLLPGREGATNPRAVRFPGSNRHNPVTEALSETSALDGVSGFPPKSLTKPHSGRLQLLIT